MIANSDRRIMVRTSVWGEAVQGDGMIKKQQKIFGSSKIWVLIYKEILPVALPNKST